MKVDHMARYNHLSWCYDADLCDLQSALAYSSFQQELHDGHDSFMKDLPAGMPTFLRCNGQVCTYYLWMNDKLCE